VLEKKRGRMELENYLFGLCFCLLHSVDTVGMRAWEVTTMAFRNTE
jgi:hypothetical protein